jgi:hypothetical protein
MSCRSRCAPTVVSILDVSRDERYDIQRTFSDLPNLLFSGFHRTAFLPDAIDPEDAEIWLLFTSLERGSDFASVCLKVISLHAEAAGSAVY